MASGCGSPRRSLLSISDDSLLDVAAKIFVHDSGATALGVMNYDYNQGTITVGYLAPKDSESLRLADIKLGKRYPIAQFNDTYQAHLKQECYWRTAITKRRYELGMNFRVSLGVYKPDDPQPTGYLIAWFYDDPGDGSIQRVCGALRSIRAKLVD